MKFSEIHLHPILQGNLDKIQFVECTKVQEQAIPWIRMGKDVAGLAQTGTGKTGAFLIPIIDRILKSAQPVEKSSDPAAPDTEENTAEVEASTESANKTVPFTEWKKKQFILVLVPTRELCDQVQEIAQKLLQGTDLSSVAIYGGTTYDKQVAALKSGAEFVIATPGRLIDLFKEHVADLGLVRAVVFDEADRMFDMGFKDDMKFILRRIPRDRQFLVFSATLNFDVLNVAYEFGADPIEINISRDQAKAENVKDHIVHLGQIDKPQYLLSLLKRQEPRQAIIFSNFKFNVEKITRFLTSNGIPAVGISSLMTQGQRNRVMAQFKADNDRNILVATDLAARGLDILGVDLVINFELPDDPENYVHRIGRTGRAGQTGNAISLVSDRDVDALQRIEEYLKHKIEVMWLDDAEITKEFKAFPKEEGRFKKPGEGRRERFEGRGEKERGQGPRRDRGHGPGSAGRGRRKPGGEASEGARRETHRDRHSGRHRDGAAPSGERPKAHRDQHRQPVAASSQGGPGRRDRHRDNRGPKGAHAHGGTGGPRHSHGGRPRPHGHGHPRGGSSSPGQRPQSPMAASSRSSQGLGAKVSGFFKKLFGG